MAARALGASQLRVIVRHVLPNVLGPIIIVGTLELASMIIFESGLSFLGLGVPPPLSSWGGMLSDGRDYMTEAWWLVVLPGLAISVTVVGVNQLGDVLRDVQDPRSPRGSRGPLLSEPLLTKEPLGECLINLTDQRALVTGASTGIGRGIAVALARAGADVAASTTRSSARKPRPPPSTSAPLVAGRSWSRATSAVRPRPSGSSRAP